ncbi:hypothetical protein [Streptomyces sp. NPDC051079]|uniref:hypothetical protein n=1 Tax=Streptomyces sp. NPDC051079 TaxID=3155043 RepID=UPI00345038FB
MSSRPAPGRPCAGELTGAAEPLPLPTHAPYARFVAATPDSSTGHGGFRCPPSLTGDLPA